MAQTYKRVSTILIINRDSGHILFYSKIVMLLIRIQTAFALLGRRPLNFTSDGRPL